MKKTVNKQTKKTQTGFNKLNKNEQKTVKGGASRVAWG